MLACVFLLLPFTGFSFIQTIKHNTDVLDSTVLITTLGVYELLFYFCPTALVGTTEQSTSVKIKNKIQAAPERLPLAIGNSWSGAHFPTSSNSFQTSQQFPNKTAVQTVTGKLIQTKTSYKGKDTQKTQVLAFN